MIEDLVSRGWITWLDYYLAIITISALGIVVSAMVVHWLLWGRHAR